MRALKTRAWISILEATVFLMWCGVSLGSEVPAPERFSLFDGEIKLLSDGSRGPFRISGRAIEKDSDRVWVDGVAQVKDRDYDVQADRALLTFYRMLPRGAVIVVRFRQVPVLGSPVYRRYNQPDSTDVFAPGFVVQRPVVTVSEEAPKLDIGGSKGITIAFGSDRTHTVNQSLQVQISGEVAEGVSVLAVLSDRHLPVGESGSTRALRELDRIFFQVQSGGMLAELGDLDVAFDRTPFGRYHRQLQGGRLSFERSGVQGAVLGAVSRGQWVSQRLIPVEGYQGPYRLPGGGGLLGAVVPESERVYVNGRLLRRGDRLDYVVDYALGIVTFAPELPIEAESRITVDYQVVEEGVRSRLLGLQGILGMAHDHLTVGTTLIRESDAAVLDVGQTTPAQNRQVAVMDAAFAPREGVYMNGEAAFSDRENGKGQAFRLDGKWTSMPSVWGQVYVLGQFRQVGKGFEGFNRLDMGATEGRWGWQSVGADSTDREGEVGMGYKWDDRWEIMGRYGRRSGIFQADRRSVHVVFPLGMYDLESIGQKTGGLTRQNGRVSFGIGPIKPGFQFQLEDAHGEGVRGTSIFYARHGTFSLPNRVGMRDLRWDVELGQKNKWVWRSELRHRSVRQHVTVWQDSVRAWAQAHRADVTNLYGWSFSGAYSRSASLTGGQRQVTHLGRSQVRYDRPGYAHQVSYRISSTGVQNSRPIFVDVGRGLGSYIWEDANGDGLQDVEEFVPDVDGQYERVYADDGVFQPARDGALGLRIELDFRRLFKTVSKLSHVSLDVSLTSDRQTAPGSSGAAFWQLFGFKADSAVLVGQRDLWTRLYLFRYHTRGSLHVSGRWQDRANRAFFGGAEALFEANMKGRLRLGHEWDVEADITHGERTRKGAGAFVYDIHTLWGSTRTLWRPTPVWQLQVLMMGGQDRDGIRDLRARYLSVEPEVIRSLLGRGRLRSSVEWTQVFASAPVPLFLGLAQGKREGQNWVWRLGMDYRFGRYVTGLVRYDGRKRPGLPVVHVGQMDVKVVF